VAAVDETTTADEIDYILSTALFLFRIVFWDVLTCKMIVDNHFTRQYIPEDNSEHHTRRREDLKSHNSIVISDGPK
jgi:hypothetical protein